VLDVLEQAFAVVAGHWYAKPHGYPCQRRVDPRFQDTNPNEQTNQHVGRWRTHVEAIQGRETGQTHGRKHQRHDRELGSVEDRNDDDRHQVVDDGKREQKGSQRDRHGAAEHRANPDCKGDIGRRRNGPAVQGLGIAPIQRRIDRRRHHEPACGRDRRQRRTADAGERAAGRLTLDLECDEQEKDRHQAVVDPMLDILGKSYRSEPDFADQAEPCAILRAKRRVGDGQGQERGHDERDPAVEIRSVNVASVVSVVTVRQSNGSF
jgi:hypothetical protein